MEFQLGTGAHISPNDVRNWTLASVGAPTAYPAECFIDQAWMTPSMQGKIGCCVGCTFEEIIRKIRYVQTGTQEVLSWRFIYAMCKSLDGVAGEGTYPSTAASVIRNFGVPLAKYFPNDVSLDHETFVLNRQLKDKASIISFLGQAAYDDAQTRKAGADLTTSITEDGIKQAINYAKANNGGVAILRSIGDTYWTGVDGISTYDKAKLLPMRAPTSIVSGHEEFLYGYDIDPANGRTRIYWLNHWSPAWCSTNGNSLDGGRGWEYLDTWLPYIKELRVSVAALPTPPDNFKYHFTKQLSKGMQGPDVVALQHVLSIEKCFNFSTFTGIYGDITVASVILLQEKHAAEILTPSGLTHGTGVVGPATLKWLQTHYGN